ncbi:MAG: DUF1003 domain-containing protein [Candidatus Rokubacteria bacterium]|nr:DUF1003 domain-containing protein [Candidatus Rokubacteria bacterium]
MNRSASDREAACQVCGTTRRAVLRRAIIVRPAVAQLIQRTGGHWDEEGWICLDDLQKHQHRYVQSLLEAEKGELTALELEVLKGLQEHEILTRNPEAEFASALTVGQRLADRMAGFGGSWSFILVFGCTLLVWMLVNSYALAARPFDPYPYILLNLVLSALAALQAPVIMMSQNRQEERDRLRALHDYQVDLKAELEIRQLHQKVDHLLSRQWERLVEIQEIQIELINELRGRR